MGHDTARRRITARRAAANDLSGSGRSDDRETAGGTGGSSLGEAFERHGDHASGSGFMLGLLTGTVLGAGLGMLLAPKSGSELRSQIGEQAASMGRAAGREIRRAGGAASGFADRVRGHGAHDPAAGARPAGDGESA